MASDRPWKWFMDYSRHGWSAVLVDRYGRSINRINGSGHDTEATVRASAKKHWPNVVEVKKPSSNARDTRPRSARDEVTERLFIAVFPTGIGYADRKRERHGDYMQLAFLPFSSLELEWAKNTTVPANLRAAILKDAAKIQAKRGEQFSVSASGQTVKLGRDVGQTRRDPDHTYNATFTGRTRGAIGKFYKITTTVVAKDVHHATVKLYEKYEHLANLKLTKKRATSRDPNRSYDTTIGGMRVTVSYHPKMRGWEHGVPYVGGWSATIHGKRGAGTLPGGSGATPHAAEYATRRLLDGARPKN